MTEQPRSAAQSIFPNLKLGTPPVVERGDRTGSIADTVYAHLKPPQPKTAPKRRLTREEYMDWSNVDERFAALVGLRRR